MSETNEPSKSTPLVEQIAQTQLSSLEKELETDGPPFDKWEREIVLRYFQSVYQKGRKDGGDAACDFTKAAQPQPRKATPRGERSEPEQALCRRFHVSVEKLLDWMNGNGLVDDHEEQRPDDFKELCDVLPLHSHLSLRPASGAAITELSQEDYDNLVRDAMCWRKQQIAASGTVAVAGGEPQEWQHKVADFVTKILHGSDIHKAWLREAGEAFILGKPMPDRPCPCEPVVGANFVTLQFPDCHGNKVKIVPTMEGNLQVGDCAAIVTSDEFEAIATLRDKFNRNKPAASSEPPKEERGETVATATLRQEWTDNQCHELVMDLRVETGYPENIHRKFYDLLKPWFESHNAALAHEREQCDKLHATDDWLREHDAALVKQYEGVVDHMEACRELLGVPEDESLYGAIEKLRDSRKPLATANPRLVTPHD